MKTTPKILPSNKYEEEELVRVVIHFCRYSKAHIPLEYVYGVYETFYPFFHYREQAEQAFEELINLAIDQGVSIGHMTCVTIGMIDSFKELRAFK
jgi:hypothetical protein